MNYLYEFVGVSIREPLFIYHRKIDDDSSKEIKGRIKEHEKSKAIRKFIDTKFISNKNVSRYESYRVYW